MTEKEFILSNYGEFFKFLKTKFRLYHESNVFFRDLHYGVMEYVENKFRKKMKYLDAQALTESIISEFEKQGIFKKIDQQTWLLNYPEFALPRPEPAAKSPAQAASQAP